MPNNEFLNELAWRGWRLDTRPDWRPLKLRDDFPKGSMMIGDAEQPLLMVQWLLMESQGLDFERWMKQRFARQHTIPDEGAIRPAGFDAAAWKRGLEVREGQSKSVWCGYSRSAGLLMECVTTHLADRHLGCDVMLEVLPSLRVSARGEPCRWSLLGVSFLSPPGFTLRLRHLYSGDVALWLSKSGGETLLLRQVYPAAMALSRRTVEGWMNTPPFTQRRRPPRERPEPWTRRGMNGVLRSGWKRLPSPLGWCRPRYSTTAVVTDETLDRLLIAEHQSPWRHGSDTAAWCMENMNR